MLPLLFIITAIPLLLALSSPGASAWFHESIDERPRREIVQSTYVDNPWQIDISEMPSLSDMPVDDRCDGIDWQKITLPDPCVDGSGTDTFIMVSKGSSDNVLIYLEGGGTGTDWITSKLMTITLDTNPKLSEIMSSMGIFNMRRKDNPFRDWTIVYLPYGTGDLHTGNRVMKYTGLFGQSETVYHVGYPNTTTALRWTAEQRDFNKVCLAGSSAGGYGVGLNFLTAHELFKGPLLAISDAGPGVTSKRDPNFTFETTNYCWGYLKNMPEGSRDYVESKGEPAYLIEWALSRDKYSDIRFGFMEDLKDVIYAPIFMKYCPDEYKEKLLKMTGILREKHPNQFYRFLKDERMHTFMMLWRFYTEEIEGISACQWTKRLINENPVDLVEI